jgi:membrane-bound lytic murein transglycosylase D
MKVIGSSIFIFLAGGLFLRADDQTVSLPDILQGAQQWAQDNLDTNFVNSLPQVEDPQVRKFLREIERQFQGDYVVDLASLQQTAQSALPLLDSSEVTRPYAAWLRSQMDYLAVAEEIRLSIAPPLTPPNAPTNQAPLVIRNPTPLVERELWRKQVSVEPWPEGAKKYVPELKPCFLAQGVPPELVWLAEVESSFDRSAESPVGAAGLFQLMPDTARRFGLSLWPHDQRFQPQPSATASAEYLKQLHNHFGDWRLAVAAYNAGEGRVQKLLDRYKTRSYDDIAVHLPAETQMYVPRVEAVIMQREGVDLEELALPQS